LDLNVNKANKLYDIIGFTDMAALTIAINNDDMSAIQSIYNKYKDQLVNLPDAKEVKDFYNHATQDYSADALADTADHFGIKGEDVENLLNADEGEPANEEPFIPDDGVKEAYNNIQEMLRGGKCKR